MEPRPTSPEHPKSNFSGEFFVPEEAPDRLLADHLARYHFAAPFVNGKRVLDIACGTGYGTRLLAEAGAQDVLGVDLSADALAIAQDRFAHPRVEFRQGDIFAFSPPWVPDLITSFETIEHVPDYARALQNLYRVAGPGTVLLISSPNRTITSPKARSLADRPANRYHTQEFTPPELMAALEHAGFEVEPLVHGQRIQPAFFTRWFRRPYRKLFRPEQTLSPAVRPLERGVPRYFLLVARKQAGD